MEIKVKVGEVEITYTQETSLTPYTAATATENYNGGHDREQLIKTIQEIAAEAQKLHEDMYPQ